MKKLSFFQGIGVPLLLSLFGSALYVFFKPLFSVYFLLKVIVSVLSLAYIGYLFWLSRVKTGRVTTACAAMAVVLFAWLAINSMALFIVMHITLIWLMRAFYLHKSILAAMLDLGLLGLGVLAAFSAGLQSGSLFLTLWCFFLVQSLFVFIPSNMQRKQSTKQNDLFSSAYRNAEAALRRLSSV